MRNSWKIPAQMVLKSVPMLICAKSQAMSGNRTFVEEEASSGSGDEANMLDGQNKNQSMIPHSGRRKRSRKATSDAIVDAMLEIAAASKMRAAAIMRK
ncbi:UNVERIFIED_CONTAM: hypothetical protein Scaly_2709800 [Sesamum calycinum]|uniref:Uncharacterized protein n=1 Tax=Sesamum calycinum TaxID=2727403 RepID=A0AAW2J3H2_9LAMI